MIRTGNIKFIKNINKQLVLNLIRKNELISAPQISHKTGLRPSTILNILNDFIDEKLIIEAGKGESTNKGGKKPILWRLNKDHSYVIGIDIEIGQLIGVILNLSGEVVYKSILRTKPFQNFEGLIFNIRQFINDLLNFSNISIDKILGMGIACAGVVDRDNGILIIGEIIPETNLNFLKELEKYYHFPIIIENNANACAQGSKWLGVAKNKKNIMTILVEFDTEVGGMGIGIIINNELYHGSSYCAGELNIHLPKLKDMIENIRNRFNESSIFSYYITSPEKIDIDLMISAAKQNDELALNFFSIFGNLIGKSIASSIALLNPEALIIIGDIAELGDIIINPIRNAIELETLSITNSKLEILCDSSGHYSVAKGAASIILSEFFHLPSLNNKQKKFLD